MKRKIGTPRAVMPYRTFELSSRVPAIQLCFDSMICVKGVCWGRVGVGSIFWLARPLGASQKIGAYFWLAQAQKIGANFLLSRSPFGSLVRKKLKLAASWRCSPPS